MPKHRTHRDQRTSTPPAMRLTPRDVQIVAAVYAYRVLTTQQLTTLFFPSVHQTYTRLARLYHHGYLDRKFLGVHADKMNTPIMYVMDRRGAELLRAKLGIDATWSTDLKSLTLQFLEHTLAINTVRAAVEKACQKRGFKVLTWQGENEIKADYDYVTVRSETGRASSTSVIPDSYFVLQTPTGNASFCLELDRGTMTNRRFKTKTLAYQAYYASGTYQRRFGTRSLRVLIVTLGKKRAINLKKVTEATGGKQRFWFTTLDAVTPSTILSEPIWSVASMQVSQSLISTAI